MTSNAGPGASARVGIDLTPVVAGDTGVARYATELWRGLTRGHPDLEVRTFAVGRGIRPEVPVDRRVRLPLRLMHLAWERTGRPRAETLTGAVDVVHSLDLIPPPTRAPLVMTTHDLLPLRRPDLYERRQIRLSRRHAAALETATAVVATCEATADDVAALVGLPREHIVVAPLGRRATTEAPGPSPVNEPFLLYVGAITSRKGLGTLAAALARVGPDAPLLLVAGPDGIGADTVRAEVARCGGVRICFLGRVHDAQLATLLHHATMLCHPSEAEGFGIPVLEAMGAGTPVIAGDIPSVRELGGTAVSLVPPLDPVALAEAITTLLADPAERNRMRTAGLQRAEPYTWEAMAAQIASLYRRLASDG